MWLILTLSVTVLAQALERIIGYPDAVFRRLGHPVTWMGRLITWHDARCNTGTPQRRRWAGLRVLLWLFGAVLAVTVPIWSGLWAVFGLFGLALIALLASSLIAQKSLAAHVLAVADGLDVSLDAGRQAVAMIVGRDVSVLDEGGVARAAIESLAENFSDGVVAPVFWMAVAGLPGAALYKAINTADSMIGHRTARYTDYGRHAARLDDLVNLPAARLSGALIVVASFRMAGADARAAWRAMRRDARAHRSPNAGWPEAAMAGALGVSLAGARVYDGIEVADTEINAGGRRDLTATDIRKAVQLYWYADTVLFLLVLICLLGLFALL